MGSPLFLLILLLFLFSLFGGGAPDDLSSDRAALLAFSDSVAGATRRWNSSDSSPCFWYGVTCYTNRVTELRLPGASLLGPIPPGTLANLTALRTLSLRYNLLSGTLPSDFTALAALRNLFLQHNHLSGAIPALVFSLRHLARLNLADNALNGSIPAAFNKLTGLTTLMLEHNRLSGEIPDLHPLRLNRFNVSFNELFGSIPESLRDKPATSFIGNSLCGGPLGLCPGDISPSPAPLPWTSGGGSSKKLSAGAIAGIAIGSVVGFLVLVLLLILCCRKKNKGAAEPKVVGIIQPESDMSLRGKRDAADSAAGPLPWRPPPPPPASASSVPGGMNGAGRKLVFIGNVQRTYDLEDLLRASAEVLGKGTTGTTYKAILEMGMVVAVKRLKDVNLAEEEFRQRIEAIGAIGHPNLVALLAYYYSKDEKLLVYEYIPNGSLSCILHGNKLSGRSPLDWDTRLEIAHGAARGIEYIHLKGSGIAHGNIKSSNIILGKSNEARVSDFGLSSLGSVAMPNQRAAGYRAQEVTDVRNVSQKADVFSFGVLLMELLTGKPPSQSHNNEDGIDLPQWVLSHVREQWNSEVFDEELLRYQNVEAHMVQLLQLAIDCALLLPDKRPCMSDVVIRIEEIRSSCSVSNREQGGTIFEDASSMPSAD